jgi:3'(2'), 5'-bisphosphate nucleotidase
MVSLCSPCLCGKFLVMLNEELQTAMNLARRAGALIMKFYETGVATEEKVGADNHMEPVTIADRTASELIVEGLEKAFPEDGILSEEAADTKERLSKKRVWMIDPIDGTLGFINRQDDFAVQIGLAENGKAIMGVVFQPAVNVLYFASKDAGAFRVEPNGEILHLQVSEKTDFSKMNLAISFNHRSPKMKLIKQRLGIKKETPRGSVGIKVGLVVTRECDLYLHLSNRTKYWDTCAPQIILEEAGGKFTDIFGGEYRYDLSDVQNHNGLVASNGVSHDRIIKKLRPLLTEFGRVRVIPKII